MIREVFLSASIPVPGRGDFFTTANPFLIQLAVRELVIAAHGKRRIVWGGHPAITPMVQSICDDLGASYKDSFVLYQSRFFDRDFPEENASFDHVVLTDEINGDRQESLSLMRSEMLSREGLSEAVFVGGMEGCIDEYKILKERRSSVRLLPLGATGGAALLLVKSEHSNDASSFCTVNFSRFFHKVFS